MSAHWQLQAKQRFSEVVRSAVADGRQFVTRHGDEVAVVIREYGRLSSGTSDFKEFLRSAPDVELELARSREPASRVDLG